MKILSKLVAILICVPCIQGQCTSTTAQIEVDIGGGYPPNDDPCWSYYDGSWYCDQDQGMYYGGGDGWGLWGGGGWYGDRDYDHDHHDGGHHGDGHGGGHGGGHR